MSQYHASTQLISRSDGRSVVAAAAYRAGTVLEDARTGLTHDYTRKRGILFTQILTPDGQGTERNALWNAAESAEKRKDARTAREWIIALPCELDSAQRQTLASDFAQCLVARYGVAVDFAIHAPDSEGDSRNHHAHLLTTTRQVHHDADGHLMLGAKAAIEWSDKARREAGLGAGAEEVKAVRELWAQIANKALEKAGIEARIDARSLQAQGMDREATQHLGPVATEMERRGHPSDRGDINREIRARNAERARLQGEIRDLQAEQNRRAQREAARETARETARQEFAHSHGYSADPLSVTWAIAAFLVMEGQQARQVTQDRWTARQKRREQREQAIRQEQTMEQARLECLERDRAAEQETRPGIRHPDKPCWQAERERLLTQIYNAELAEKLSRWYRIKPSSEGLILSNASARIIDHGDRITAASGNDREIAVLLDVAKVKGWTCLALTGDKDFQRRAAQAALTAGFTLADPVLAQTAQRALEAAARRADIQERAQLRQGYRVDAWAIRERWHWRQQERAQRREAEKQLEQQQREQERALEKKAVTQILEGVSVFEEDSLEQRLEVLQQNARPLDVQEVRTVRQAAMVAYDQNAMGTRGQWVEEARRLGGWEKALAAYQAQHREAATGLMAWTPSRKAVAGKIEGQIQMLQTILSEREQAASQGEQALRKTREQGAATWSQLSPYIEAAREAFHEARAAWLEEQRQAAIEKTRQIRLQEEARRTAEVQAEQERAEQAALRTALLAPRLGQSPQTVPCWISDACASPTDWKSGQEKTLKAAYDDAGLLERAEQERWYTRPRPDLGGLNLIVSMASGNAEVVDGGDAIRAEQGIPDISLILDLARAKAWRVIDIQGNPDFQEKAARMAVRAGFVLSDNGLDQRIRQALLPETPGHPAKPKKKGHEPGDDW